MTAEQWLADLEAKAAEASLAEKQGLVCGWWDIAEFREAVTPEAVLRLVAMVLVARLKKPTPSRRNDMTDLSTEALMARRKLAEQATPGPWFLAEEDDDLLITSRKCWRESAGRAVEEKL